MSSEENKVRLVVLVLGIGAGGGVGRALLYIGLLVKSERKKSSSRILFGSVKYL